MEEYLPQIEAGNIVYAGVDYEAILREAEKEADIILWDGGNNDLPFYQPDLHIVIADPTRAGDELNYYPGETNFRMADVIIVNKIDTAGKDCVNLVLGHIKNYNPDAKVIQAILENFIDKPDLIKNKKVLLIEDGPTATHGNVTWLEKVLKKMKMNVTVADPKPFAVGTLKKAYEKYPHLGLVLPSLGYSPKQIKELEQTINKVNCDSVIIGTPIDLRKFMKIKKPAARITYAFKEVDTLNLAKIIKKFVNKKG
jgi:predicted GTPase